MFPSKPRGVWEAWEDAAPGPSSCLLSLSENGPLILANTQSDTQGLPHASFIPPKSNKPTPVLSHCTWEDPASHLCAHGILVMLPQQPPCPWFGPVNTSSPVSKIFIQKYTSDTTMPSLKPANSSPKLQRKHPAPCRASRTLHDGPPPLSPALSHHACTTWGNADRQSLLQALGLHLHPGSFPKSPSTLVTCSHSSCASSSLTFRTQLGTSVMVQG